MDNKRIEVKSYKYTCKVCGYEAVMRVMKGNKKIQVCGVCSEGLNVPICRYCYKGDRWVVKGDVLVLQND